LHKKLTIFWRELIFAPSSQMITPWIPIRAEHDEMIGLQANFYPQDYSEPHSQRAQCQHQLTQEISNKTHATTQV